MSNPERVYIGKSDRERRQASLFFLNSTLPMPTSRDEAYWKIYSTLLLQLKGLIEAGKPTKPSMRDKLFNRKHTESFPNTGNANLLKPQPFVELLETHIRNSKDLADLNDWWHTGRPDKLYLDSQHPTVALKLMVDLCEKMRKSTKGGPVVELENLVVRSLAGRLPFRSRADIQARSQRESELSCESIFVSTPPFVHYSKMVYSYLCLHRKQPGWPVNELPSWPANARRTQQRYCFRLSYRRSNLELTLHWL